MCIAYTVGRVDSTYIVENHGIHILCVGSIVRHAVDSYRWPLVLRFIKGAVHIDILLPVVLHALFTAAVVYLDTYVIARGIGLPATIVWQSLSLRWRQ